MALELVWGGALFRKRKQRRILARMAKSGARVLGLKSRFCLCVAV